MDCLDCGEGMDARMLSTHADPAFFNGPTTDVRQVWICQDCSPDGYRRSWADRSG